MTAYIWENETDLPEAIRSLTGPTDEEFLKHPASKAYYVSETPMAHLKSEATKGLTNIVRDWFVKRVAELNVSVSCVPKNVWTTSWPDLHEVRCFSRQLRMAPLGPQLATRWKSINLRLATRPTT